MIVAFATASKPPSLEFASRRAFRLYGDQFFYSAHFAVHEHDVRHLDRCSAPAGGSRLEIAGTQPQCRSKEIRAVLLKSQAVCVEALRTAADQVLLGHLPRA